MSEVKEFYVDDLVYKFDEKQRIAFGLVIDSYESSDTDDLPNLQKGQILVLWNNHSRKQICKQSKVRLLCRCILHGDIVRRFVAGKETQKGYCKGTKQFVTVQIVGTNKIVDNVNSARLSPVKVFDVGDAVCLGSKSGRIQAINQLVKMQSKCGSVVEIRTNINHDIHDYWSAKYGSFFEPCYPGQSVVCCPMNLKDPKWLKKSKLMKRRMDLSQTFTIQSAEYISIEVWWYTNKGHTEYCELTDSDIKQLKSLPYTNNIEISERYLFKLRKTDIMLRKSEWMEKKSVLYRNEVPKCENDELAINETSEEDWFTEEEWDNNEYETLVDIKSRKRAKNYKFSVGSIILVDIVCIDSKITVVWQDGTEEKDISSTKLYYSVSLDDHEFFPGEWVMANEQAETKKYGVVQKVDDFERTAEVKWFNCTNKDGESVIEPLFQSEVSVYELKKHNKYVFRPGSIVKSKPTQQNKMGRVIDGCPQGYVIVKWINGQTENCFPQNIELIPDNEEYDFSEYDSDEDELFSLMSGSWETESIQSYDGDVSDQLNLQMIAAKVDFIRDRISYLKDAFKKNNITKDLNLLKDLLRVYDNSKYLDKFLGTSYFSNESKHFQMILVETRRFAKSLGIDLRGRLFQNETNSSMKLRSATEENIQKIIQIESKINSQIAEGTQKNVENTPESEIDLLPQENLIMELLLMLKMRMDLVYAEIISRLGVREALTVLTNSLENTPSTSCNNQLQQQPPTPEDSFVASIVEINMTESFSILDEATVYHHFYATHFDAVDHLKFLNCLKKEYKLLRESLPSGVWVRAFANRTDLLSFMIQGPAKTPYEDGLFLFDLQLSSDYPNSPPLVHYISYSSERLNPNLYVEGKVCVSLLGTWKGRGSEVWSPNSTLLQLIVSIQGLILVAEPYYNEAGYEKQTHTQQGYENSRTYNELVILKLVQSMTELLKSTPTVFKNEILTHFTLNGDTMCERLRKFCSEEIKPEFPLSPVSKGLKLSLDAAIVSFQNTLKNVNKNELSC